MTNRIERLRKKLQENTHFAYREDPFEGSVLSQDTEKKPLRIRKSLAFADALSRMPIYIQDDELIVGGRTIFNLPEHYTAEELKQAASLANNIKDPVFNNVCNESVDEAGYKIADTNPARFKTILEKGLGWFVSYAKQRLASEVLTDSQREYYEAVEITVSASQSFVRRYAELAGEKLLESGLDEVRRRELQEMKDALEHVAEHPPRSFYEALQLIYIVWIMLWTEAVTLVPFDRIDQLLYPFLKGDAAEGRITEKKALELIQCFFIKVNFDVDKPNNRFTWLKGDTGHTITLGGSDPEDPEKSGENDVTFLCITALKELGLIDPHVHVRLSPASSRKLWDEVIDLVSYGRGIPIIDFDQNIERALRNVGIYSEEDIRDYCGTGCWEIIIGGRTSYRQCGNLDLLLPLEWLLHNGNKQEQAAAPNFLIDDVFRGIPVEKLDSIESFQEFKTYYFMQLRYYISTLVQNVIRTSYGYTPFLSSFVDDCLSSGREIKEGGARYKETDIQACSLANIADSLHAVDVLVFQKKELSLSEFSRILKENYQGHEALRQRIIKKIPKFGNNVNEVDSLAQEVSEFFAKEVSRYTNGWGGPFRARIAGASSYVDNMNVLKASPDGRRKGEYTSQNASPQLGADRKGPTALLNSITSLDTELFPGGFILDLKFSTELFRTQEGREKIRYLLEVFAQNGGMQLQINTADADTLRDAQKHPEKHRDLIVRVWGFSAYFIDLPVEFQEHVIQRTEISV